MIKTRKSLTPQALEQLLPKVSSEMDTPWSCYTCELVTPLFGGGIQPGEIDNHMPIRVSSIRGNLRFWWRIAFCANLSSKEMFEKESEIWGGIGKKGAKASKIKIKIEREREKGRPPLSPIDSLTKGKENQGIKYAIGSAGIGSDVKVLNAGFTFKLLTQCKDEFTNDLHTALQFWSTFGGIGARSRRGFGAVLIHDLETLSIDEIGKLKGRVVVSKKNYATPEKAWSAATEKLFKFRQGPDIGRNMGNNKEKENKPGRSFWPEPDQIRRFTGKDANGDHAPEHPAGNVFPRAAFGLPITFEFRGRRGEPETSSLTPKDGTRMASPLLLRPYFCGENQWKAMAVLLPGWEAALTQPLALSICSDEPLHWPSDAQEKKKIAELIRPMSPCDQDDPLSAFMEFFTMASV